MPAVDAAGTAVSAELPEEPRDDLPPGLSGLPELKGLPPPGLRGLLPPAGLSDDIPFTPSLTPRKSGPIAMLLPPGGSIDLDRLFISGGDNKRHHRVAR